MRKSSKEAKLCRKIQNNRKKADKNDFEPPEAWVNQQGMPTSDSYMNKTFLMEIDPRPFNFPDD